MKITREGFEMALMNAMSAVSAGEGARPRYENAVRAAFKAIGVEIEEPCSNCAPLIAGASATRVDGSEGFIPCNTCSAYVNIEYVWVERTWADVRQYDVIRPAGQADETHAAEVIEIGPVNRWHAAPGARQYAPNESPLEWSARRVTMLPLRRPQGDADAQTFTPEHGMRPDAAVEIRVTRGELAAIEALGGWGNRVSIIIEAQEQGIVTS